VTNEISKRFRIEWCIRLSCLRYRIRDLLMLKFLFPTLLPCCHFSPSTVI